MHTKFTGAALLMMSAVLSAPAQARPSPPPAVHCSDSARTVGNAGYVACQGPTAGNIAAHLVDTAAFAGYGSFELVGTTNDPHSGPFASESEDESSRTLTFDHVQKGYFVLGLKGGPDYSLYLFDGGTSGIGSLKFDTLGLVNGSGHAGPELSHAALFTSYVPYVAPSPASLMAVVPEPETGALMLAGLAAIGFVAKRRKSA